MKMRLSPAMRRATELFRNGELSAAAEALRGAFGSAALQPAPLAEPRHAGRDPEPAPPRRSLGETLAEIAAQMPVHGLPAPSPEEPELPDGARFDAGSFACAAGERAYRLYVPKCTGAPRGMIVMLHGCTQSPVDFAKGTGMNRLAEAQGLLVLYPEQARTANLKACWNWFSPEDQSRDSGEPAILAGMTRELRDRYQVPAGRVFVAGLSAGAAMAVILGRSYPELFAAVGAHSGLPYKAASGASAAFAAMGGSPAAPQDRVEPAVPHIIFHGSADTTVAPVNGERIAAEGRVEGVELEDSGEAGGRRFSRSSLLGRDGTARLEHWRVEGLGHAWSGGHPSGSYTDPDGPDASAEMLRFFLALPEA